MISSESLSTITIGALKGCSAIISKSTVPRAWISSSVAMEICDYKTTTGPYFLGEPIKMRMKFVSLANIPFDRFFRSGFGLEFRIEP